MNLLVADILVNEQDPRALCRQLGVPDVYCVALPPAVRLLRATHSQCVFSLCVSRADQEGIKMTFHTSLLLGYSCGKFDVRAYRDNFDPDMDAINMTVHWVSPQHKQAMLAVLPGIKYIDDLDWYSVNIAPEET